MENILPKSNEIDTEILNEIGLSYEYAKGTIRISLCKDNTLEDVRSIYLALQKIML